MAVTAKMFANSPHSAYHGEHGNFTAASQLKCALFTSAAAPTQAMTTITNVRATCTEVSNGNGYTTGGVVCANPALTFTSLTTTADSDDASWSSATFTARYAVYYEVSTGYCYSYLDFGEDKEVTDGTFTIEHAATGIFTVAVA